MHVLNNVAIVASNLGKQRFTQFKTSVLQHLNAYGATCELIYFVKRLFYV